ncbi:transcription factor MYB98-like [Rhodamnia argentea]|uniref:Transcription factor MYB98-like n=1 Tax=Rhodamnia argentea TaxID=178133 RepID=A0A8B8PBR8_9MYRT|nr:transcription factor MYB98-like [Rhodamnia argentea]
MSIGPHVLSLQSPSLMEFQTELNEDLASQQVYLSDSCLEPYIGNNETTFATTDSINRSSLQDFHQEEQFFFSGSSSNLAFEKQTACLDPFHVYPYGISANLDDLHQCRQVADGYAVVMDNFQVGGNLTIPAINTISGYDRSHMFFSSNQNVSLTNFAVPDEVSHTTDESGCYQNDSMNMSKVAVSSSVQRTCEGCQRSQLYKGQWTAEEDGNGFVSIQMKHAGLIFVALYTKRSVILQKDTWSEEEDKILIQAHAEIGNKWSEIAKKLPSRTQNSIKNHWNAAKRRQYTKRKRRSKNPRTSLLQEYIQSLNSSASERFPEKSPGSDHATGVNNNVSANKLASAAQPRPESNSCLSDEFGEVLELLFDEKLLDEGCATDPLLQDLPCPPDASVKDGGGEFGMEMLDMDSLLESEEPNKDLDLVGDEDDHSS